MNEANTTIVCVFEIKQTVFASVLNMRIWSEGVSSEFNKNWFRPKAIQYFLRSTNKLVVL